MSIYAAVPISIPLTPPSNTTTAKIGSVTSLGDINSYQTANQSQAVSYSQAGAKYRRDLLYDTVPSDFKRTPEDRAEMERYVDSIPPEISNTAFVRARLNTSRGEVADLFRTPEERRDAYLERLSKNALKEQQKLTPEASGLQGAIRVPAASSYADAKTDFNSLVSDYGDLSQVSKRNNIELCGFLNDLPKIDIDLSSPLSGIEGYDEFIAKVNGVGKKFLGVLTGTENLFGSGPTPFDRFQEGLQQISNLASAIQQNIPTISCGGTQPLEAVSASPIGSALFPNVMSPPPIPSFQQIGVTPSINISSPDVTVQSLNDVLEAGEF
jgi:hypothetical protein